ncbi:hypothetical protein P175DRAFT_0512028 [Aspergillus ochraceoroseus IBT 24754]|uniref:Zn(2)-C6 fungal-type domain-containing protein n=1 Tax=Aspergillus ochraceoroseus IBT 24754 TaxID=1392256 RepID=A0A2T5LNH2_9EURO|nr:uncharacterized protein P175DRAFT_0512028 [Aspergillus ochraceoroseus IBT 24754]PTU17822.1 hypothetical protein P175DRAFT_0512028 [Aspergillus ochraceoroseus IBT 24754]
MRSRTGCLTCRTRKLKCDERKPVCSQCRKGGRECRPSEGVIFRHQQNASMNKDLDGAPDGRGNLNGFYSYKNTFDKDSVWLDIPKHVIFVDNSDPYAEDLEAALGESEAAILAANSQNSAWDAGRTSSAQRDLHGLEALSAVATHDPLSYPALAADQQSISTPDSINSFNNIPTGVPAPPPNQLSRAISSQSSPSISIPSDNGNNTTINFLLNPSQSLSPPIDPTTRHTPEGRGSALMRRPAEHKLDRAAETDREISFLLRHFSEVPGLWMDLYDLGTYFASYVPVRALQNPLLKYAACAYAAKQLGHIKIPKPAVGGVFLHQAFPQDPKKIDWSWNGAKYYEKAIQLLMKELEPDDGSPSASTAEAFGGASGDLRDDPDGKRSRHRENRLSNGAHSDEILAATAILSVYEFLDATGPAWNRHLSGVKSLLDLAEVGMRPLQPCLSPGELSLQRPKRLRLSKARKAIFWNFARQDYLAAFINETRTRLNTEDLALWTEAGIKIDNMGFVRASNTNATGYPEGEDVMKEDLISNALVWILSKIVNFVNTNGGPQLSHPGAVNAGPLGVSEQAAVERWYRLEAELDVWYNGLPDSFHPCARIGPPQSANQHGGDAEDASALTEIWYSLHMCSSAMQHYHMARILLLINKPHESTARRGTITNRLSSYRSIESDIRFHGREIVGIAMACPAGSARINSLQPLFVSGQCLIESRERRMVLRMLRDIEAELGWATEYRVQQLLREWGWEETAADAPGNS